jgi:putative iron-dependent peroxidase
MTPIQPGILQDVPSHARYLSFSLLPEADPAEALAALAAMVDGDSTVVGIGRATLTTLGCRVEGLRDFPALSGAGVSIPSTPVALWLWLRGDDRGEILLRGQELEAAVEEAFLLDSVVDAFRYAGGRDLTGYEDGTENPTGPKAVTTAAADGAGAGLDGGSFVAVQVWEHDLGRFHAKDPQEQDLTIGRRIADNGEIDDAPESAHVKRTAQESFQPEAFVLRRSMPWADTTGEGLVFVAFGASLDAYETLLRRMIGEDDGTTDALFTFTRPLTGAYLWCPPVGGAGLDLSALGL